MGPHVTGRQRPCCQLQQRQQREARSFLLVLALAFALRLAFVGGTLRGLCLVERLELVWDIGVQVLELARASSGAKYSHLWIVVGARSSRTLLLLGWKVEAAARMDVAASASSDPLGGGCPKKPRWKKS